MRNRDNIEILALKRRLQIKMVGFAVNVSVYGFHLIDELDVK